MLRELIAVFRADGPRLEEDLADALARGDAQKLSRTAHTLKGVVGTFAAARALAAAQQVELLAGQSDLAGASAAAARLETELGRLRNALGELESVLEGGN